MTHLNESVLEEYEVTELEEVTYESADGTSISGFEVKPPGFSFENEYPLLVLIHGTIRGAFLVEDRFGVRTLLPIIEWERLQVFFTNAT